MITLTAREFVRNFNKYGRRAEPITVTKRGKPFGIWTSAKAKSPRINIKKRLAEDCPEPLPFTFVELLQETRR